MSNAVAADYRFYLKKNTKNKLIQTNPQFIILDCGGWPAYDNSYTFGAICGEEIVLGEFCYGRIPSPVGKELNETKLKILFGLGHNSNGSFPFNWALKIKDKVRLKKRPFCSSDELYIFIPDIHICMGSLDPFDRFLFRKKGANPMWTPGKTLWYMIEKIKKNIPDAVITQTGDLFDIWGAEIAFENYYNVETMKVRNRSNRAYRATLSIAKAIDDLKNIAHGEHEYNCIKQAFSEIDNYVLGNHDWEIFISDAISGIEGKRNVLMSEFLSNAIIHTPTWMPVNSKIMVGHGHIFDGTKCSTNNIHIVDKSNANRIDLMYNVDQMMEKVTGKAFTFIYVRELVRKDKRFNQVLSLDEWTLEEDKHINKYKEEIKKQVKKVLERDKSSAYRAMEKYGADGPHFSLIRYNILKYLCSHLELNNYKKNSKFLKFWKMEIRVLRKNLNVKKELLRLIQQK